MGPAFHGDTLFTCEFLSAGVRTVGMDGRELGVPGLAARGPALFRTSLGPEGGEPHSNLGDSRSVQLTRHSHHGKWTYTRSVYIDEVTQCISLTQILVPV